MTIPAFGLARTANGILIDHSGLGEAPIKIRDHDTGGVVQANPLYGPFSVQNVARISIWAQLTLGNLTNVFFTLHFGNAKADFPTNDIHTNTPLYTPGVRVLEVGGSAGQTRSFGFTVSANVVIPIINPGVSWFAFDVLENHAIDTDDSLLGLWYARSYLSHDIGHGIP